jgi:uncharacterized protein (TIGR02145 family)
MKTNFFRKNHLMRLALLLLPLLGRGLGGGGMLFAQGNGVTVSNLAVSVGSPTTVTFNVSWNKATMPVALWSDTVWVWVDYNNAGKMERLPLLPGATLTATSPGGKVIEETDNIKGVWVAGNARTNGNFSATVQLFTDEPNVGGVCVYASNYPPVGKYSSDAPMLLFTGMPMYDIQLAKSGGTFLLPCDYTVTLFTDATGAPGQLNGTPFNNGSVPQYAASTKTWTVGSQIWSDVINDPACNDVTLVQSYADPYCRRYTNGTTWFYYNWPYVIANENRLCPSPWHVPTKDDFIALDVALDGNGSNRTVTEDWISNQYFARWGGSLAPGFGIHNGIAEEGKSVSYVSTDVISSTHNYSLRLQTTYVGPAYTSSYRDWGYMVRCVK